MSIYSNDNSSTLKDKNSDDEDIPDDLCCCEFLNEKGERSHILTTFCDCDLLDDTFERMIKGEENPSGRFEELSSVVSDRLRVPWLHGAIKIELFVILPFVILPILGIIASIGPIYTLITFISLPILLRIIRRKIGAIRTSFHYSFMLSSAFYSFLVFTNYGSIRLKWHNYLANTCLLSLTLFLITMTRFRSRKDFSLATEELPYYYFCRKCEMYIDGRDHHCDWLDCCIGKNNRKYFIYTLISSIAWTCHLVTYSGGGIINNYSEAYAEFPETISFVISLYGVFVNLFLFAILIHQIRMSYLGMSYLDWRYKNKRASVIKSKV